MNFQEWQNEQDLILSELDLLGRLSEQDLILELDTSNGIAGAVDKTIGITNQNVSLIEKNAESDLIRLSHELKDSQNPDITLKTYLTRKQVEINKFKSKEKESISQGYVAKGITFLVDRLSAFLTNLFSPIISRLKKAFVDSVYSIIPNSQNIAAKVVGFTLFSSIVSVVMTAISGNVLFGAITSVLLLIYFRAMNSFLFSLIKD